MSGAFLVVEGGDAAGKTTQAHRLAARLRDAGRDVVETFEPGRTELGRGIRALLLDGTDALDPLAEALLVAADRAQEIAEVIRPALADGRLVVSDRYVPSSLVYQGVARGLGVDAVDAINQVATGGVHPDLVVVLDVADEVAETRADVPADRMEREGPAFHSAVRQGYRDLAAAHGWVVVDGEGAEEEVGERVWKVVAGHLGLS